MTPITAIAYDDGVQTSDDALVPWWSFTKTVLATAALHLVSRNKLSLDEKRLGKPFTLRQLLQHRAGIPDYGQLASYHKAVLAGDNPWSIDEMLRRVRADLLTFAPGTGWEYSNVGYLLVRQIIENTTGVPLGVALNNLVFDPLAITGVRLASEPHDLDETAWRNTARYHPGWVYHGLLIGSAANAAMFLHHLLKGRLLPAPLLAAMLMPHPVGGPIQGRPWTSTNYGLGLMIGKGDMSETYVGHTGSGPGSTAAVYQRIGENCTAAAFTPTEVQDIAERQAMALASRDFKQRGINLH